MKTKIYIAVTAIFILSIALKGQNVGINSTGATPNSSAQLDLNTGNTFTSPNGKGLLVPNVSLSTTADNTTVPVGASQQSLLVYNSNNAITGTGAGGKGYYWWDNTSALWINLVDNLSPGAPWLTTGNTGTTASSSAYGSTVNNNFLGTTDSKSLVFATNNLERMRINPTLGDVCIGSQTIILTGDILSVIGNTNSPWAVNGYSNWNGSGVYGSVQSGTTVFAAVQGEYVGTSLNAAGVRGNNFCSTSGSGFYGPSGANPSVAGVHGTIAPSIAISHVFGVYGDNAGNISASGGFLVKRSGGVAGTDFSSVGGLGYTANSGNSYSIYGFGVAAFTGGATGRMASNAITDQIILEPNNQVGLGVYGGAMGGWIKGVVYGVHLSGNKYGAYIDGKTITNNVITQLVKTSSGNRAATYVQTSTTVDILDKGKSNMNGGKCHVSFNEVFKNAVSSEKDILVNITPNGPSNGFYVTNITSDGFDVIENNNGHSSIPFTWMASGIKQGFENVSISPEILSADFDKNMDGVMHNENDPSDGTPIWWDGSKIRFDNMPRFKTIQMVDKDKLPNRAKGKVVSSN